MKINYSLLLILLFLINFFTNHAHPLSPPSSLKKHLPLPVFKSLLTKKTVVNKQGHLADSRLKTIPKSDESISEVTQKQGSRLKTIPESDESISEVTQKPGSKLNHTTSSKDRRHLTSENRLKSLLKNPQLSSIDESDESISKISPSENINDVTSDSADNHRYPTEKTERYQDPISSNTFKPIQVDDSKLRDASRPEIPNSSGLTKRLDNMFRSTVCFSGTVAISHKHTLCPPIEPRLPLSPTLNSHQKDLERAS